MSSDITNKLILIQDNFVTSGVYPRSNINHLARTINNIEVGEGIRITRNPVGGVKICNESVEALYPFKIFGYHNSSDFVNTASSVKVFEGNWDRNGCYTALPTDDNNTSEYATMDFETAGTYIVYLTLDDCIKPAGITLEKAGADEYSDYVGYNDALDKHTKIGAVVVSDSGAITNIIQYLDSDIDDYVGTDSFTVSDIVNTSNLAASNLTFRVRKGTWYDAANNTSKTLVTDVGKDYITLTSNNISADWHVIIEYNAGVNLTASIVSSSTALNQDTEKIIAELSTETKDAGLRVSAFRQTFTGDVYQANTTSIAVRQQYDVITSLDGSTWVSDVIRFHA